MKNYATKTIIIVFGIDKMQKNKSLIKRHPCGLVQDFFLARKSNLTGKNRLTQFISYS